MHREWLAMEHYRLHVVERWPESRLKRTHLAAIRSTIASLERTPPAEAEPFCCIECSSRKPRMIEFPATKPAPGQSDLIAA